MHVIPKSVMREGLTLILHEVRSVIQGGKVEKYFCASAVGKFCELGACCDAFVAVCAVLFFFLFFFALDPFVCCN